MDPMALSMRGRPPGIAWKKADMPRQATPAPDPPRMGHGEGGRTWKGWATQ